MTKEDGKKPAARRRKPVEPASEETVESELTNTSKTEARRLRVYKRSGDFFLDLPPGCRCTFGYFNPSASGMQNAGGGYPSRGAETMKTTALRIYQGAGDKQQLACFLGVDGFRDDTIRLTKIVERVVVERRMADDGEGTVEWGGKQEREMVALPEAEFSAEDDQPF